jgi:hypothetical protein
MKIIPEKLSFEPNFWSHQRFASLLMVFAFTVLALGNFLYGNINGQVLAATGDMEGIKITAPLAGDDLLLGSTQKIDWQTDGWQAADNSKIIFRLAKRAKVNPEIYMVMANITSQMPFGGAVQSGSIDWKVGYSMVDPAHPVALGSLSDHSQWEYEISALVVSPSAPLRGGQSGFFDLKSPSEWPVLTFVQPATGQTLLTHDNFVAKWNFSGGSQWDQDTRYNEFNLDLSLHGLESNGTVTSIVTSTRGVTLPDSNTGTYVWTVPNALASEGTVPNPNDRELIARYYRGESATLFYSRFAKSGSMNIAPYKLTAPISGENLYIGQDYNITWDTKLDGEAHIYFESYNKVTGSKTNLPIARIQMNAKSYTWKVGYIGGQLIDHLTDPNYENHLYIPSIDYSCTQNGGDLLPCAFYKGYSYPVTDSDLYKPLNIKTVASALTLIKPVKETVWYATEPNEISYKADASVVQHVKFEIQLGTDAEWKLLGTQDVDPKLETQNISFDLKDLGITQRVEHVRVRLTSLDDAQFTTTGEEFAVDHRGYLATVKTKEFSLLTNTLPGSVLGGLTELSGTGANVGGGKRIRIMVTVSGPNDASNGLPFDLDTNDGKFYYTLGGAHKTFQQAFTDELQASSQSVADFDTVQFEIWASSDIYGDSPELTSFHFDYNVDIPGNNYVNLTVSPSGNISVARSQAGKYFFVVAPLNGFTGQVEVALQSLTLPAGVTSSDAQSYPRTLTFNSSAVQQVELNLAAGADAQLGDINFKVVISIVNGSSKELADTENLKVTITNGQGGGGGSEDCADLSCDSPAFTLNLTMPFEEGPTHKTDWPLRLAVTKNVPAVVVFHQAVTTNAQNQATINIPAKRFRIGTVYMPYAWSLKHLPVKATSQAFTLTANTTAVNVTIPKLLAGDINEDGDVNFADQVRFANEFVVKTGLTADFNNDGDVNFADFQFIAKNFDAAEFPLPFTNPFN